jgi:hypothetical protein
MYRYLCICTYLYIRIYIYMHICSYVSIHIYKHTYIYIYTSINIHILQQAWTRPSNRSPSPPGNRGSNQNPNHRLSAQNLENLGTDFGYDRVFQSLAQGPPTHLRERPQSASANRSGPGQGPHLTGEKVLAVSSSGPISGSVYPTLAGPVSFPAVDQVFPPSNNQLADLYDTNMNNGDYKMSHFKELELRRGDVKPTSSRGILGTHDSRPKSAPTKRPIQKNPGSGGR